MGSFGQAGAGAAAAAGAGAAAGFDLVLTSFPMANLSISFLAELLWSMSSNLWRAHGGEGVL